MSATQQAAVSKPWSPFIVGPAYDMGFFIFSPAIALALSAVNWAWPLPFFDEGIVVMIHAHLFAVFFRSHGNPTVRSQFPVRFFLIPVLLYLAMISSSWVMVCCSVLATWWDVYHSGQQTFGLGRIYDSKYANDMSVGRDLDQLLNFVMYSGPILGGASLMAHVDDFDEFATVDATF